jgi:hypothetical protein
MAAARGGADLAEQFADIAVDHPRWFIRVRNGQPANASL